MPPPPPISKPVLAGLTPEELQELLKPLPAFRSLQVYKWIIRGVRSFQDMTDLALPLRDELERRFSLYSGALAARLLGDDGTVKLQIALRDGAKIETVLLADGKDRKTACLSTQAGCPMACVFCKTGSLGFFRNLEAGEIVEQFLRLKSIEPDISNIVVMGMGEPLLNLSELRGALAGFTDPRGLALSQRRITLSTAGIAEGIRELAAAGPGIGLALSLTTADGELRKKLMPAADPLPVLKEALLYYRKRRGKRITLEAVLLGGVNTRLKDAGALASFARGLDVVVNLIPWNPVEGMSFEGRPLQEPSPGETAAFTRALEERGFKVTRRFRKGRDISGACGQLGEIVPAERRDPGPPHEGPLKTPHLSPPG